MRRALVVLGVVAACSYQRMTVEQVDTMLANSVSQGAAPERVVAVLDSLHIEHSTYDGTRQDILGVIRNASGSWMVSGSIHMVFSFDTNRRLTKIDVKEVLTGP